MVHPEAAAIPDHQPLLDDTVNPLHHAIGLGVVVGGAETVDAQESV